MEIVNITEAKAQLSALLAKMEETGEDFIIKRMGKPIAKVSPYQQAKKHNRIGLFQGQFKVPDDFKEWPKDIEELWT